MTVGTASRGAGDGRPGRLRATLSRWGASAAAALIVVAGIVLWTAAETPWPLIAVAVALVVLAVAQFASGTYAVAVSAVLAVLSGVVVGRIAPLVGAGMDVVALWFFAVLGGIAAAALALPARHRTNRPGLARALAAVAVPGVAVVAWLVARQLGSRGVAWAMHGDSVWNLVIGRLMIDDGGIRPELHPNSSPAAEALVAMVAAVGRDAVDPARLLAHDVDGLAEVWIALILLTSVLAALVAVRTPRLTRAGRWLAGIAAGLVPFSWYVAGFSWELGFLNAPAALVLLLASWIAWLECRIAPLRGAALLSAAAVALLATWAPLAIVPVALAAAALVADRRRIRRGRAAIVGWAIVALPVPLYALVVTLGDLRREGAALAVDGGFPDLGFSDTLVTAGVAVTLVCTVAVQAGDRHRLVGAAAIVVAAVAGVGYLVAQRIPTGTPWGYYPAKMSWLVLVLLIVIAIGSLGALIPTMRPVRPRALALATVSALALAGTTLLAPPVRQPVAANILPWLDVMRGTGVAAPAEGAEELFAVARPGVKSLALRYGEHDAFMNLWLLQLESETSTDPVRAYAFSPHPDDVAQSCDAIRVWGGGVVVHTRDPGLEAELGAVCGDASWTVALHG